ncbi:MAG TPA: hypothetical protein VGG74_09040 [Kofleriaceae bacterium]|jgi:hypothetical protein
MSNGSRLVALLGLLIAPSALAQPTEPAPPGPAPAPAPAPTTEPATPPPSTTPPAAPVNPPASAMPNPPAEVAPADAPTPPVAVSPEPTKPNAPPVKSKWAGTLYGFVEADTIYDSTQGLNDLAGNSAISRPNTYTGDHGQTTMGARNSRIGYKLVAPEYNGVKASAQLEMDFLGNQPTGISEASFWQNPTMRFRHYNLKLETPIVDILIGQYWDLFGWQSYFHPATVEIQGVPGQVYGRAPQIRVSKTIKTGAVDVDLAIAAVRPVERDSAVVDGQAGVKFSFPTFKAYHTAGGTGTALDSAAIGVSVLGRRFAPNPFPGMPQGSQVTTNGYGVSVDLLLPIVAATKETHDNALTLTASFADGAGDADQYTGLSGGVANPAVPNPGMVNPAPAYTSNMDNGLALYYLDSATNTYSLHAIQWLSFIAGLQYYLPGGHVFLTANYSHMNSGNADLYGAHTKVFNESDWADGNIFWDVTPAVRLGLEFAWFQQGYADGTDATDYRTQFSGFFIF